MEWSAQQNDIFQHVTSNPGSVVINAVAGSGKTTTIVEIANRLTDKGIFLAFNKEIAKTLSAKLPAMYPASTFHSLGFSMLKEIDPRTTLNTNKIKDIIADTSGIENNIKYPVQQLVSLAKSWGIGIFCPIEPDDAWTTLVDTSSSLDLQDPSKLGVIIKMAKLVLTKSNANTRSIDFDDMLYLPLLLNLNGNMKFKQHKCIIVDEAQDTNAVQIELLRKLTSRVIAVGDRNQAIYGFRGADHTAIDLIKEYFGGEEFPLTVTYRCPSSVTKEAQRFVPHIECADTTNNGTVTHMGENDFECTIGDLGDDTVVICRTNAPLIRLAMRRLRLRKPFRLMSDFPKKFIAQITSLKANDMADFKRLYTAKHDRHVRELEERKLYNRAAVERDKYSSLMFLADECKTLDALISAIQDLIAGNSGVTLSTIHKTKGLEFENVVFYGRNKCPSEFAVRSRNALALQQEDNLIYVGITRAKNTLTYVDIT